MTTRQEIIEKINAFLRDEITHREAYDWASEELGKTSLCEDPAGALITLVGSYVPGEAMVRPLKEQLLLDREVLMHGVPCPHKDLGKTVEAYWLAFTPWEKIVLCQIEFTETGERTLEVMEETWEGDQLFQETIALPIKDEESPLLINEDVWKKREAYWSDDITAKEFLEWVVNQLEYRNAAKAYRALLMMYWKLRRPEGSFYPEYMEGDVMRMWKDQGGKTIFFGDKTFY